MHRHRCSHARFIAGIGAAMFFVGGFIAAADRPDEFKEWQRQEQTAFKQFKDERDREFVEFLRTQWQEFEAFRGIKRDPAPKPVIVPVAPRVPSRAPEERRPPAPPPVVVQTEAPPAPAPLAPPAVIPPPDGKPVALSFYGQPVVLYYDPSIEVKLAGAPGPDSIAGYWSALAQSKYEPLLQELRAVRDGLRLVDWAYVDLVRAFSRQVHPRAANDSHLLMWFLLTKSGFRSRIAYDEARVHLLVPSDQEIYETKFLLVGGTRHYAALADDRGAGIGRVHTYDSEYPGPARNLDLRLSSLAFTKPALAHRDLNFEYRDKRYAFRIPIDRHAVEFLGNYPVSDLPLYFLAATSAGTGAALVRELRAVTSGMNEEERLNFLLRFAQTAFAYKTDDQQFGREKYMFVEETLSYPFSDCEDRAVLYAWLVREVLGGETIGLVYPGHVATAVRLRDIRQGAATVDFDGKRYVVADPTYIGADLGMAMPAYASTRPDVIRIR